jgi:predicted pyridoxine 5'-phosphate oxidase superfamily flavin-nucleotide-binding protein
MPLKLTDDMKAAVSNAYDNRTPVVVTYVDENGQPSMSLRGTTQAYSDNQLAIWARAGSGMPESLKQRPNITLFYRDPATRTTLQFRGRARQEDDQQVRDLVFDRSPANEQAADPDRKGVVIIVDLDRVDGRTPEGPVMMRANA